MDLYSFSLTLGAAGLLFMAFLGLSHGHVGGRSGHTHGGHAGHGPGGHGGHAAHGPAGHAHAGHDHAGSTHMSPFGHASHNAGGLLKSLLSPRVLFSLLLGFGTAGVALRPVLGGPFLFAAAAAGGIAFERVIVNTLWNFMFRFASSPAMTLESAVEDEARAVTNFDASGCGLISVEVDGRNVQVLGTLTKSDRESGVRIRAGDSLRIEDVDAGRNRCTVRRS